MNKSLSQSALDKINRKIANRDTVFYWQTDRDVTPEDAGRIWADRHRYFTDEELLSRANEILVDNSLVEIHAMNKESQTNLGNVNSVRTGTLDSGKEIIIRSHPKGILNGYFHAESAAASAAVKAGLPSYDTLAIHDYEQQDDFAFQIITKLPGTAMKIWLEKNPQDENKLVKKAGAMMASVHSIAVEGFGPFIHEKAVTGRLIGRHETLGESVRAGLDFNLDVLVSENILNQNQVEPVQKLFANGNPLLDHSKSVLVHNDFADWNLLTDGEDITGILDWDECVASNPITDLACWSTFFEPARMQAFLEGYWSIAEKPTNFEEMFELLRLRYVVSKMTLRVRRYNWEPSEAMREKIQTGKTHLSESLQYFNL